MFGLVTIRRHWCVMDSGEDSKAQKRVVMMLDLNNFYAFEMSGGHAHGVAQPRWSVCGLREDAEVTVYC